MDNQSFSISNNTKTTSYQHIREDAEKSSDRINVLAPPAPLVAAKGDNSTDDATTIQNIINYVIGIGGGEVYVPPTPNGYKLGSSLTINLLYVTMTSSGAILNFTNSGAAFIFVSSGDIGKVTARPVEGFILVGAGQSNTSTIAFQFSDMTGDYGSYVEVRNCDIHEFYKGSTWNSNTWLTKLSKCNFYHCEYDVYFPSGLTNSGENILFDNCAFFNGDYGVYNMAASMRFLNCSFDYFNYSAVRCLGNGVVFMDGCHIEASSDNDYWLYTDNSSSTIFVNNTHIVIAGNKSLYAFGQSNGYVGGIHLRNIFYQTANAAVYPFPYLITGVGQTQAIMCNNTVNWRQGNNFNNYLSQGSFEAGNYNEWSSGGTSAPSIDNTTAHTGTNSLKLAAIAGNYVSIYHDIPCKPGDNAKVTGYLKTNFNGSVDTFILKTQYLDSSNNVLAGTSTVSFSASSYPNSLNNVSPLSGWALYSSTPPNPAPAGAVKCRVSILQASSTTTSDGKGNVWWDDLLLTID